MLANIIAPVKPDRQEPSENEEFIDNDLIDKESSALVNDGYETSSVNSDKSTNQAATAFQFSDQENLIDMPTPADAQPSLIDFHDENQIKDTNETENVASVNWEAVVIVGLDQSVPLPVVEDGFEVNFNESSLPASASVEGVVIDKEIMDTMNTDRISDSAQIDTQDDMDPTSTHAKMGGIAVLPAELLGAAMARRKNSNSPRTALVRTLKIFHREHPRNPQNKDHIRLPHHLPIRVLPGGRR